MEDNADEKKGLLEATLAWQPGGKPLDQFESVQPYLERGAQNRKKVRLLQALLAKHRRPQSGAGEEKKKEKG